ncbi:hypothetical protein [Mangrovimonas sp. YM274]|uniref:hypothetical protein n=1 Tax=Mangrovimonas sp. YM274 TaxID=3070660 RepID=UPI0027DD5B77|nr:hypothetical protein [Mangrovimonas sp. YM274]WMI68653.1 hypothetical protein RBH95_16085 [Mangrovimonas sp. YM274]
MKKNLLGALVIFFVTVAFLLMLDDMRSSKNSQLNESVDIYNATEQPNMATTDTDAE